MLVGRGLAVMLVVGAGVVVAQIQLALVVQDVFLQKPVEQVMPLGHCELVVHVLLHSATGEAVGDGEGDFVGVGDGDGDGVVQTQSLSVKHCVFLQKPAEHNIPVGQSALTVQTLLHCGTGVGEGDGLGLGEGEAIVKDRLQAREG